MNENSSVSSRSAVDVAHFALFAFGFFFGAGGVVVGSICGAVVGAVCLLWSLFYFAVAG